MKRIYFHLPHYPNWFDGATKYQTKVFEYFRKKSERVYAFGRSVDVKHSRYWLFQKLYKLVHGIGIVVGIIHIIRIPKNSIIVLINASFLHYSIPLAFNKYWKKQIYFLIVHDLVQRERPTFLRKKIENYFIRNSDKVVTNSKTTRDDLVKLKLAPENTEVVYPGLDADFSLIPKEKLFPEKIRLLFVGSVEKRKGIIYLIEALGKMPTWDFELNLIGSQKFPGYYQLLRERINELGFGSKIFFRGRISSDELLGYYLNSSIFVFPTLYEGYGMAVAEAMAYGLPILTTRIPAIEEFVQDGKEGFLVEPRNPEELSNALTMMLNDVNLLKSFSKNALLKAKSFPTWDETSERIWELVGQN